MHLSHHILLKACGFDAATFFDCRILIVSYRLSPLYVLRVFPVRVRECIAPPDVLENYRIFSHTPGKEAAVYVWF
jgi:hypothetical protein